MTLPASSLSQVCRSVADHVAVSLEASRNNIKVTLGNPASAVPATTEEHHVNLFFYRVEPNAYAPATSPNDRWLLRLSCLVTPFGLEEDLVGAGDNDLRLLGGVLSAFHSSPALPPVDVGGTTVRPQVVFQPLVAEDLNQLWSTQGDLAYRPSVAYEVALVPVPPVDPDLGRPLVGSIGFGVRSAEPGRHERFLGSAWSPPVGVRHVDTRDPGWAPAICFVEDDRCVESVSFALGGDELASFAPRVWIAGERDAPVRLRWEVWDAQDGWRPGGADVDTVATGPLLDAAAAAEAETTPVTLPFDGRTGQALLHAERTYTRPADGAELTVRSNPLLVNVYAS
jgi:hypothetical protein